MGVVCLIAWFHYVEGLHCLDARDVGVIIRAAISVGWSHCLNPAS